MRFGPTRRQQEPLSSLIMNTYRRMFRTMLAMAAMSSLLGSSSVSVLVAAAQEGFTCDRFEVKGVEYDMSNIGGLHQVEVTEATPPTTTIMDISFNPCEALKLQDSKPRDEQCPDKTWACLVESNSKKDRATFVTRVIPLAGGLDKKGIDISSSLGDPQPQSSNDNVPLIVVFRGGIYNDVSQAVNVTFECSQDLKDPSDPTFSRYDSESGMLYLNWKTLHACATGGKNQDGGNKGGNSENSSGGGLFGALASLIKTFFSFLFFGLIIYFIAGAFYRYQAFGSRGADLIPHRDFWRDVPYVVRDVFRPRDRGGYSSLS